MKYFSYVVVIVFISAILPLFIHSEPITYVAEASLAVLEEEIVECSCIKTARNYGVDIPYGTNAEDFKPNSTPEINGLVLFKYSKSYHIAVIVEFVDGGMNVYEGNFNNPLNGCREGHRFISWEDPYIRGFWTD